MDPNGFQNVDYQNEKESLAGYPSCTSSVTLAQVQMTSQCPQNLDYVDDEIFNELFPQKENQIDQGYGNDPDGGNPFRSQNENVDMIRSSLLQRTSGLQSSSSSSGLSGQTLSEREQSRANSISNFKMYLLQDPPTAPSSYLSGGHGGGNSGGGVVPGVVGGHPSSAPAVKTEPIEPSPERDYLQQQLQQQPSSSRLLSSSSSTSNNNTCLHDIASSSSSCNQQQQLQTASSSSSTTTATALAAASNSTVTSSSSNSNSY